MEILGRNEPGDRWVGARTEADGQSGTNVADELLVVWTGEYPRFWQADGAEGQEPMVSRARMGREEGEEAGGQMVRSNAPTERRAEGREGGG